MGAKKEIAIVLELDNNKQYKQVLESVVESGALKEVVISPTPVTKEGNERLKAVSQLGLKMSNTISKNIQYVFCFGSLKPVEEYVKSGNTLKFLLIQGGFVGSNISAQDESGVDYIKSSNYNLDIDATDFVLSTDNKQIEEIMAIGDNFATSEVSACELACAEGMCCLELGGYTRDDNVLNYLPLKPDTRGLKGSETEWGSILPIQLRPTRYRAIKSAVVRIKHKE